MIYAENIFICLAAPLLVSLLFLRAGSRRFALHFTIGMAVCLLSAYFNSFISATSGSDSLDAVIVIAPMVEEIGKFLPLLYVMMMAEPSPRRLLDTALAMGVGFATFENACYLTLVDTGDLLNMVLRGLAVGAMHIGSTAFMGASLSYSRQAGWPKATAMMGVVSISIVYQAVYNLLVSFPGPMRWLGYVVPLLFALWLRLFPMRVPPAPEQQAA